MCLAFPSTWVIPGFVVGSLLLVLSVLGPMLTYLRLFDKSYTTKATSGQATIYQTGAPQFTPFFLSDRSTSVHSLFLSDRSTSVHSLFLSSSCFWIFNFLCSFLWIIVCLVFHWPLHCLSSSITPLVCSHFYCPCLDCLFLIVPAGFYNVQYQCFVVGSLLLTFLLICVVCLVLFDFDLWLVPNVTRVPELSILDFLFGLFSIYSIRYCCKQ